jgi:hypothetical protein
MGQVHEFFKRKTLTNTSVLNFNPRKNPPSTQLARSLYKIHNGTAVDTSASFKNEKIDFS